MSTELANIEVSNAGAIALPPPRVPITIRAATLDDFRFIDDLQSTHNRQVGFMHEKTIKGKIELGHVLVAEDEAMRAAGYCIGNDRYFKRDDVGVIYHMNISPGKQRGLVGATLLKAMFDRAAYGCKLFCCWCAQDIAAIKFWEAMGFTPLAFRAGGRAKKRVHIFWQKRIRAGDDETPYWYPSLTAGGAIAEDRLVFPIPPGTHWSDAKPVILPGQAEQNELANPKSKIQTTAAPMPLPPTTRRVQFGRPPAAGTKATNVVVNASKPKPAKKPKQKHDPRHIAAARELRDRYLEHVNSHEHALPAAKGKYHVSKHLPPPEAGDPPVLEAA
jgi:hypothetical protein